MVPSGSLGAATAGTPYCHAVLFASALRICYTRTGATAVAMLRDGVGVERQYRFRELGSSIPVYEN